VDARAGVGVTHTLTHTQVLSDPILVRRGPHSGWGGAGGGSTARESVWSMAMVSPLVPGPMEAQVCAHSHVSL
jgi:hypothetical protein